jgi:hypothetical protein
MPPYAGDTEENTGRLAWQYGERYRYFRGGAMMYTSTRTA